MAEKEETTSSNGQEEEEEADWGTLEELLLVCAVNRHGSNSWDSIAVELQKRKMNHNAFFSPNNCHQKYVDLKRRFHGGGGDGGAAAIAAVEERENSGDAGDDDELLRMVDELRRLRVEELKREVERRDVSIVSLQLKVKRLEEERESKKAEEPVASDLRIEPDGNAARTGEKSGEPERSSPEKVVTGDSAEDRSFNESNSTNNKAVNNNNNKAATTAPEEEEEERESKAKHKKPEEKDKPDPVRSWKKAEPVSRASRLGELGESLSESKRESAKQLQQQQQQQSSDVQSSASLSKKKRRRVRGLGGGGGSSGDEAEEVSPANKRISVKSQPLIKFLDIVQSHKHGSVFQRRLPSQETEKYRNMIRQHMDLDTVQTRLDRGIYTSCHPKFYRDLLLIFTNAVVFYRKSSAEHIAARELRKLVIDEIAHQTRNPDRAPPVKTDLDPQNLEPVVKKPRSSTTMVVCRRRSSSSMQALSESMKKKDGTSNHSTINNGTKNSSSSNNNNSNTNSSKADNQQKKVDGSNGSNSSNALLSRREKEKEKEKENEKGGGGGANAKKLLTRERSSLGRGGLRLSSNNSKKIISKESINREKMGKSDNNKNKEESSDGEGPEMSLEMRKKTLNGDQKQEKGSTTALKKQGVANFLKRMKQNSPSSQEKAKNQVSDEEVEDEEEEEGERRTKMNNSNGKKKGGNSRREREVEAIVTRNGGRRGERELAASRRNIGRPPKRKAAMISTPDSGKGGRSGGRDGGEKAKKKTRR